VASAIVSVNDFFLILLYPILICIVLDAPWSYIVCCFRSFQFEEEVPSTFVANIHQLLVFAAAVRSNQLDTASVLLKDVPEFE